MEECIFGKSITGLEFTFLKFDDVNRSSIDSAIFFLFRAIQKLDCPSTCVNNDIWFGRVDIDGHYQWKLLLNDRECLVVLGFCLIKIIFAATIAGWKADFRGGG